MTWYLSIRPINEPFDMGVDDLGRSLVIFNMSIVKVPSNTLQEEIFGLLVGLIPSGLVASGGILISSKASVPNGDGPFISVIDTGGAPPQETHNSILPAYPRPSVKVVTRAKNQEDARSTARAAYNALAIIRNTNVPAVTIT